MFAKLSPTRDNDSVEIKQTFEFAAWLRKLTDVAAKVRILRRLDRLQAANPGDHRNLIGSVSELRLTVGPAYRIYYTQRGDTLVIILCGGGKSTPVQRYRKSTMVG